MYNDNAPDCNDDNILYYIMLQCLNDFNFTPEKNEIYSIYYDK